MGEKEDDERAAPGFDKGRENAERARFQKCHVLPRPPLSCPPAQQPDAVGTMEGDERAFLPSPGPSTGRGRIGPLQRRRPTDDISSTSEAATVAPSRVVTGDLLFPYMQQQTEASPQMRRAPDNFGGSSPRGPPPQTFGVSEGSKDPPSHRPDHQRDVVALACGRHFSWVEEGGRRSASTARGRPFCYYTCSRGRPSPLRK